MQGMVDLAMDSCLKTLRVSALGNILTPASAPNPRLSQHWFQSSSSVSREVNVNVSLPAFEHIVSSNSIYQNCRCCFQELLIVTLFEN